MSTRDELTEDALNSLCRRLAASAARPEDLAPRLRAVLPLAGTLRLTELEMAGAYDGRLTLTAKGWRRVRPVKVRP